MRSPFNANSIFGVESEPEQVKSIFVEKYERCSYCNSKLVFAHDLNVSFCQVIETSRCPGCGVTMHPKKYTLQ